MKHLSASLARHNLWVWLLFLFGTYVGMTSGYIQTDEAWFLQVVNRTINGEVLYRDIYFGITPFSLYLSNLLARLFGAELLVIRLIMAGSFSLICWLTYQAAILLKLGKTSTAMIMLGLVVYLPYDLRNGTPYTITATLFQVATFYTFLSWLDALREAESSKKASIRLFLAGALAGLCIASKQSIGLYTGIAFYAALMVVNATERVSLRTALVRIATASAGILLVIIIILAPVLFSGSVPQFIEYGFLNKGKYVEVIQNSNSNLLLQLTRIWTRTQLPVRLTILYASPVLLLPFACYGLFLWLGFKRRISEAGVAAAVICFTVAASAGLFPNMTIAHLVNALPMLLIGFVYAIDRIGFSIPDRLRSIVQSIIFFWLGIGVIWILIFPLRDLLSSRSVISNLPHFHGIFLNTVQMEEIRDSAARLKRSTREKPTFLFIQPASLYYLVANLVNPTPYDLPVYPALGIDGEDSIISAIQAGEISQVCLHPFGNQPRKPVVLEAYILENMHRVRDAGPCNLYQSLPE